MRQLAKAQIASSSFTGVAFGIIAEAGWPAQYREALESFGVPYYTATLPPMPSTMAWLYMRVRRPGLEAWIKDLALRTGASRVVVHFHNAWMSGIYLPLDRVPGCDIATVATFHSVNRTLAEQPFRRALHSWMGRRLVRYGASLTSVDAFNVSVAESILGLPASRFAVIRNGVSESTLKACPRLDGAECLTVGHVGLIAETKGWRLVAEAVVELARKGRKVRLLLAGEGPDAERAASFAAAHPAVVKYLGYVENPRETLMPQLDVLAALSRHEGMPMVVLEAMSLGLPVVATGVGGIPEAVENGVTGVLIPRTAEALVAELERLYVEPARLRALGRGARERFIREFEVARIAEQYSALYARCWR